MRPSFSREHVDAPSPSAIQSFRTSGFSLVELLVVMAILSILLVIGARILGSTQPDQDLALIEISNALETARQLAVSQNTYTYVAFTTPASAQDAVPLCVAVFQSKSGDNVVREAVAGNQVLLDEAAAAQQNQWSLVRKPKWLRNASVENTLTPDSGLVPVAQLDGGKFSKTLVPLPNGQGFKIIRRVGRADGPATITFDRLITFSPGGTAFIDNRTSIPDARIGFLVRPSRGIAPTATELPHSAAITVSGLLGNSQIFKLQAGS